MNNQTEAVREIVQKRTESYKFTPPIRQAIYKMIGEYESLRNVAIALKKEFNIKTRHTSIKDVLDRFADEAQPAIRKAREEFNSQIIHIPMASKRWRLTEILNMYKKTKPKDKFFRAKLLALGRAEMGESFDKLANAIRDSGGDTIVNIVNYESGELERAIRELAAVSADSNATSRF